MIIIETCPECGHDLLDEVLCTYPPIPKKVCTKCGWSWTGKREEIIRVPFDRNLKSVIRENAPEETLTVLNDITGIEDSTVLTASMNSTSILNIASLEGTILKE